MKYVVLACALCACAGDDATMTDPDAGSGSDDGAIVTDDSGMQCMKPALDQPWLAALVSGAVSGLAAAPRATTTQRNTARAYLQNQLTQIGWTPQLHSYPTGSNVYATIPATTGATKQIIVGAHFDTVSGSPGANDNATGSAAVLAIARYLKDMNCRKFAVTIVFFDEEESGLFGSRAFANMLQVANVLAVHTVDQIGWDNDNDMRFELELPTQSLEAEYRAAATIVAAQVAVTATQGTDHQSFREQGMAAIGITEEFVGGDTTPNYHMASDTFPTVKQSYLQLGTKLVAQVVMTELAP